MSFLLPFIGVFVVEPVFALTNPDIIKELSTLLSNVSVRLQEWFSNFSVLEVRIRDRITGLDGNAIWRAAGD